MEIEADEPPPRRLVDLAAQTKSAGVVGCNLSSRHDRGYCPSSQNILNNGAFFHIVATYKSLLGLAA
jgi:hypothetical protein